MDVYGLARGAIQSIVAGLERGAGPAEGVELVLSRFAAQSLARSRFTEPEPTRLSGCRHLPEAVGATLALDSEVAAAVASIEDLVRWRQTAEYTDAAMGQPGYTQNYAYAELVGPTGFFPGDDFLLGLMILGPRLHYLDHYHPAPELYWMLTGPSEWKRGAEGFVTRPAGGTVWHAPRVVHATKTFEAPLLTVWAWTRDVSEPARLVKAGNA